MEINMEIYSLAETDQQYGKKVVSTREYLLSWSMESNLAELNEDNYLDILPYYAPELFSLLELPFTTEGNPFFLRILVELSKLAHQDHPDKKTMKNYFSVFLRGHSHFADFIFSILVHHRVSSVKFDDDTNIVKALVKGMLESTTPTTQMRYSLLARKFPPERLISVLSDSCQPGSTGDCGNCTIQTHKLHRATCLHCYMFNYTRTLQALGF